MTRKFWWGIALIAGLGVAAMMLLLQQAKRVLPADGAAPASTASTAPAAAPTGEVPAAATAAVTAVAPAAPTTDIVETPRPGYDRYRAEIQRIRAARRDAEALQPNERCIGGQRFRKAGTEWVQAGSC